MSKTWRFTPLQFLVAWEAMGRDRLPFPLVFRGGAPMQTDFDAERRRAAKTVHDHMDDELYRTLIVLAEPLARVEICGHNGPRATQMMRVHAGLDNVSGSVAVQLPGSTFDTGGEVVLSRQATARTPARIVEVLPRIGAGRARGVVVDTRDLEPELEDRPVSIMQDYNHVDPGAEAKRFFSRPFWTYGEITVDTGPAYDGRKDGSGATFGFVDYVDDGRYLIRRGQTIAATPASPETMTAQIRRLVDRAVRRGATI